MEHLASKVIETQPQASEDQPLMGIPGKFALIGNLLPLAFVAIAAHAQTAQFVGSATCKRCHAQIFDRWSKTRMAKIVVDPAQHPEAIIPDLTKADPLVKFNKSDIAFVMYNRRVTCFSCHEAHGTDNNALLVKPASEICL